MSSGAQTATRGRSASLFVRCDRDVKADGQDVRLHPSVKVCAPWLTEFQLRMSFLKVSPSPCHLSEVITSRDPPPGKEINLATRQPRGNVAFCVFFCN